MIRGFRLQHGPGTLIKPLITLQIRYHSIELRDYQIEALESIKSAFSRGIKRPAFVLATGGGKTMVFSHLIPQIPDIPGRGNKVLVLAHKEELIKQAYNSIRLINPDLSIEIDMRNMKPDFNSDIIVGSVPTLVRVARLNKYNPLDFKAIILDECHHATASSWTKILKHFNADTPDSDVFVIGCTATMERSDGQSLGEIFDEIVFERSLLKMVQNKELVDVKFSSIKADIDLTQVATKFNDYEVTSLSSVVNSSEVNLVVALSYIRLRKEYDFQSTLMFCVDINHCKTLCGVLQRNGVNAQYVTGDTVKHERRQIIEDFKNGVIDVLCNVQVFTEGTDIPNIDSLFLVRPTKSRPLLIQMIGRGLRLHKDKTHCHVVDIAGTRGTGIQSVPTLFSLPSDYIIHGKNIVELYKEKEVYDKELEELKRQEAIERERLRKEEELAIYKKMMQLEKLEDKLKLDFITIDGFLALEAKDISEFTEDKNIHKAFTKTKLDWIRLEYDVWGYPLEDKFFLIRRQKDGDNYYFRLMVNSFTSGIQKRASEFKCGKFNKESEITSGSNLTPLLAKAEVLNSELTPRYMKYDSPATAKQLKYLTTKLSIKLKQYYDMTPELERQFVEKLALINRRKASSLIFGLRYSTNSLFIKWELQRMLGPDKKSGNQIKKIIQFQAKKNLVDENLTPLAIFE